MTCQNSSTPFQPKPIRHNFIDIEGQTFGRLIVLGFVGVVPRKGSTWLCECECGRQRLADTTRLRNGHIRSCGCLYGDTRNGMRTHGMNGSPIHRIWGAMVQRCHNPTDKNFHYYGGRGITVCDRWRTFENFFVDMGHRPDGMSLERVDNSKGYSPDNCEWATKLEQSSNTRRNRLVTWKGRTQTFTQWAKELGLNVSTARTQLHRGWSIERIFSS